VSEATDNIRKMYEEAGIAAPAARDHYISYLAIIQQTEATQAPPQKPTLRQRFRWAFNAFRNGPEDTSEGDDW
jgi:hypothetical protein